MNRSRKTSTIQIALILAAMGAGALVTRIMPERVPFAAYVPQTKHIPTDAVFRHANLKKASHEASRDLTGIDVDVRRLAMLGRIS